MKLEEVKAAIEAKSQRSENFLEEEVVKDVVRAKNTKIATVTFIKADGTEIRLSPEQEQKAYRQHRENMEEREAYKSDYYNEW